MDIYIYIFWGGNTVHTNSGDGPQIAYPNVNILNNVMPFPAIDLEKPALSLKSCTNVQVCVSIGYIKNTVLVFYLHNG